MIVFQDQIPEIEKRQEETPFVFTPPFESPATAMLKFPCINHDYFCLCVFQVQVVLCTKRMHKVLKGDEEHVKRTISYWCAVWNDMRTVLGNYRKLLNYKTYLFVSTHVLLCFFNYVHKRLLCHIHICYSWVRSLSAFSGHCICLWHHENSTLRWV